MTKREIFECFIMENMDKAYRFSYTYMKNQQDAEDVLNDSVLKAWKSIDGLREIQYIKTWFYKIIANTAITHLKKHGRIISLEDETLERLDSVEDTYQLDTFNDIVKNLNPKYKEIVVLRFFEELSLSEIAQTLDINENTVKTRLYRALKLLKIDVERDMQWIS